MLRQKDYISWSQYSLWTRSKREYWKKYGLGEDRSANKFFTKGKELADALQYDEDGEYSSDGLLSFVLENVPKLSIMEHKITVELLNRENILCLLDSYDGIGEDFYEYKTGKEPWTQEKVDAHDQLLMYALAIYIKGGRLNVPDCKLFWIETEETEDGLKYTGVIEEFSREFTIQEVLDFEQTLIAAIEEIDAFEYVELEIADEVMDRYIEIKEQIETLTAEADLIRLGIQVEMEADDIKYASATNGKFSLSETKKWTYSQTLVDVVAKFAKQVKIAQTQEQKDKIATCTVTTSLKFSANKTK